MNNVFTTVGVVWEVLVQPKQGDVHEFSNYTTKEFEQFLEAANMPYEEITKGVQAGVDSHNAEEAPEFAASIQRKALKENTPSRGVGKTVG